MFLILPQQRRNASLMTATRALSGIGAVFTSAAHEANRVIEKAFHARCLYSFPAWTTLIPDTCVSRRRDLCHAAAATVKTESQRRSTEAALAVWHANVQHRCDATNRHAAAFSLRLVCRIVASPQNAACFRAVGAIGGECL